MGVVKGVVMKKLMRLAEVKRGSSPVITRDISNTGIAQRLVLAMSPEQLDKAVDKAAQISQAIVAQFAAAPTMIGHASATLNHLGASIVTGVPALEIAVEFFVPPCAAETFRHELEGQLQRKCPPYAAARSHGELGPVIVRTVPSGSFHQWRIVWRTSSESQRAQRWAVDRGMIDGLLHQAQHGWREMAV